MDILIIDDELLAREEIARLLSTKPDVRIVGQCANAIEGLSAINRLNPEIVFLDIQMPRISGLEMLSMIDPAKLPRIVFLTAFNEYALQAFDQNAFDYLLKPVDPARLEVTLERLRQDRTPNPALLQPPPPLKQVASPGHQRVLLIKIDEIEYVTSTATGVYVTTDQGSEHFIELTLRTLEEKTHFLRCHRQYLVNPDKVKELSFRQAGAIELITQNNHHIPVSRRLLAELKDKLWPH